jgi:hypothetical protein
MGQLTIDQTGKPLTGPLGGLAWVLGAVTTLIAAAGAAVLTVVFAAAVALVALMAVALFGLLALIARGRSRRAASAMDGDIIEARKVGHAWVAYGWDRQGQ